METGFDGNEILHSMMASSLLGDFTWVRSSLTKVLLLVRIQFTSLPGNRNPGGF